MVIRDGPNPNRRFWKQAKSSFIKNKVNNFFGCVRLSLKIKIDHSGLKVVQPVSMFLLDAHKLQCWNIKKQSSFNMLTFPTCILYEDSDSAVNTQLGI